MNISTIALALLAWQMLTSQKEGKQKPLSLDSLLSPDTKGLIDCVQLLAKKQSTSQDKIDALLQVISNPTVASFASTLLNKKQPNKNDEGYEFEKSSATSQEFFRPIDNIAGIEIKHKLYLFYDNWYVK